MAFQARLGSIIRVRKVLVAKVMKRGVFAVPGCSVLIRSVSVHAPDPVLVAGGRDLVCVSEAAQEHVREQDPQA